MLKALTRIEAAAWMVPAVLLLTYGGIPLVLYLAGPLRGDGTPGAIRRNQVRMMARARLIQELLPQAVLVVPHGNFSYIDEAGPGGLQVRARVLEACERLLLRCDGLVLCGSILTQGMLREKAAAEQAGLPIVQLPEAPLMEALGGCAPEYGPYRCGTQP